MEESNCLALPQAQLAIFKNKANKKPQALLHRDWMSCAHQDQISDLHINQIFSSH